MSEENVKTVLKMMPYGFYAVTSHDGDEVNAMVANWITQASFKPRLLVLALQQTSHTHGLIEKGRVFAINIFKNGDQESMMSFTKGRSKKPDKMKEANYTLTPETGCPILDGAAAYIELKVVDIIDVGGDHDLVVGEPINAGIIKEASSDEALTLMDVGWSYAG